MYDFKPYPVTVRFPWNSHLYDLRCYLGQTDSLDTNLSYEAQLYAMLPYRVESVQVKGPSAARPGETSVFTVSVAAGAGKPGLHVFRVEVLGPAGEALPWYAANIRAEGGSASWTIPWARTSGPAATRCWRRISPPRTAGRVL